MTVTADLSIRAAFLALGAAWRQRLCELVHRIVDLDDSGEWVADGYRSCAAWVADRLDIETCTAREWLRVGRDLRKLPEIDSAFENGTISYSKVRTLTRFAEPDTEQELLAIAQQVPAGRLNEAIARWLQGRETPEQTENRQQRAESIRWRLDADGMTTITMRLAPANAAALAAAIDQQVLREQKTNAKLAQAEGAWPSLARQRARALRALLVNGTSVVTEVIVHVRGDGCTLDDGTPINDHAVARLLDHAFVRLLIHDAQRRPINASGKQRFATARQKRVVRERDAGRCVDCGSTNLIEYDHEPAWELTRHTIVDELRCRCAPCHHAKTAASET